MNHISLPNVDYCDSEIALMNDAHKLLLDPAGDQFQDMAALIFVRRGEMFITMDDVVYKARGMQVLISRPGRMLSNPQFSPDFDGHAVFLSVRYSQSLLTVVGNVWEYLLSIDRNPVFDIPNGIRNALMVYRELLLIEVHHKSNQFYNEVVSSLLKCMLCSLISDVRLMLDPRKLGMARAFGHPVCDSKPMNALFSKFIEILTAPQQTERKLSYYAVELCVTPKYLSSVCKRISGRTAHEWIRETITNNINHCLRYSDMSIKEISYKYGFSNLGFFSRYVKENLGKKPSQLRHDS